MTELELYSTEIWEKCSLLYKKIKNIISDNYEFTDAQLKQNLLVNCYFIKENLAEAYSENKGKIDVQRKQVFLKEALLFTTNLEQSLILTEIKSYIAKDTFNYLINLIKEIKTLLDEMIIKEKI